MTCNSCLAESAGANNLDGSTRPANGFDNNVSTVPGCSATKIDSGRRRDCSMERVRMSILSADFDIRYEAQPPSRLSLILPTRAESAANTALWWLRSLGRKCFATNAGPMVFTANTSSNASAVRPRIVFSGCRSLPRCRMPLATMTRSSRSSPVAAAAASIERSSVRSR